MVAVILASGIFFCKNGHSATKNESQNLGGWDARRWSGATKHGERVAGDAAWKQALWRSDWTPTPQSGGPDRGIVQTVESAGLLCTESDVTVVYARREAEAATKEGIHEECPLGVIVPSHVTEIKNLAFADCQQVLRVTVPESVTSMGENAFAGCQSFHVSPCLNHWQSLNHAPFYNGDSAFAECTPLKHITLPKSLVSISSTTFEGCEGLTSILIPGSVKFIEESAFFRYYSLESVTLPDSVKEIGESAFEECASLINIHIPKSVTVIGKHAFANCECLSEIKIPSSVGSLGDFAFEDCYSLESLFIDEGVPVIGFGAFRGCQSWTSILISASLRDTVEEAFDCDAVENVTLFRKNGSDLIHEAFLSGRFPAQTSFTPWYRSHRAKYRARRPSWNVSTMWLRLFLFFYVCDIGLEHLSSACDSLKGWIVICLLKGSAFYCMYFLSGSAFTAIPKNDTFLSERKFI